MSVIKPNIKITKHSSNRTKAADFTKLPSYQYRHVNWSDLKDMHITGPSLKGPRIRAAPSLKDRQFERVPEDSANYQPHIYNFSSQQEIRAAAREVKEVHNLKGRVEDWENVVKVNLSYQELGGNFQRQMLTGTLKKLLRCETLVLIDNRIADLSYLTFPCVQILNLSLNLLTSFEELPRCPRLAVLNLAGNKLSNLGETARLGTQLQELRLRNNPVVWNVPQYRKLLFEKLPSLRIVDGISREELQKMDQDLERT